MKYYVNDRPVEVVLSGGVASGKDQCLLDLDDDLSDACPWQDEGYVVSQMLDQQDYCQLKRGVSSLVGEALSQAVGRIDHGFSLERYHQCCPDQKAHLDVIDFLRGKAAIENLPIDYRLLDDRVSELCGKAVSCRVGNRIASGYFFVRIVRPRPCHDNNPPHKDAWIDRLRHGLNLYLPLAGSDENSSLALAPGSHLWSESAIPRTLPGADVNGVVFSVPSVAMSDDVLKMIRPAVEAGEGLVFSPYLIHGGAVNFNRDTTRVSLEMRFWRKAS